MNAFVWLNYQLFGSAWGDQLIVGYLMHAIMVGLVGFVAYRIFRLSGLLTVVVMLVAAMNPAYWSTNDAYNSITRNSPPELLQYPVFQIEMLCGLFMLTAFIAFVKGRYALFSLAATIALLLKETALTVPIAALVLTGAWPSTDRRRTVKNLIWLALPLLIWGAGRTFIFEYGRGIYVLSSTSQWGWLLKPVRNLLYLPSTLYRGPLHATEDAIHSRDLRTLLLHGFEVAANIAWWVALLYAVYRAWRGIRPTLAAPGAGAVDFGVGICSGHAVPGHVAAGARSPISLFLVRARAGGPIRRAGQYTPRRRVVVNPQHHSAGAADFRHSTHAVRRSIPQLRVSQALREGTDGAARQHARERHDRVPARRCGRDIGTAPGYFAQWARFRGRIVVVNSVTPILGCQPPRNEHTEPSRYSLLRSASSTEPRLHRAGLFLRLE